MCTAPGYLVLHKVDRIFAFVPQVNFLTLCFRLLQRLFQVLELVLVEIDIVFEIFNFFFQCFQKQSKFVYQQAFL